ILGAAGLKRFTVTSQSFGIDRVENQKIVHHERMNDGTFTLFDGNGDAAFLEAVSKLCNPFMQGLRLLLQLKRFGASLPGYSQMDSVLPIAPIQADIQLWGLSACTFGFTRKTDWNGTAARAMAPRAAYRYPNPINTP